MALQKISNDLPAQPPQDQCLPPVEPNQAGPLIQRKKPQLLLLDGAIDENVLTVADATESPELDYSLCAISLNALLGSTMSKTTHLTGSLKHQSITVLIDLGSGSTHNFIHLSVAKRCGFSPSKNQNFTVGIANGGHLISSGCLKDVSLNLQGYEFITELFLLDISGWMWFWGLIGFILWA